MVYMKIVALWWHGRKHLLCLFEGQAICLLPPLPVSPHHWQASKAIAYLKVQELKVYVHSQLQNLNEAVDLNVVLISHVTVLESRMPRLDPIIGIDLLIHLCEKSTTNVSTTPTTVMHST